MTGLVLPRGSAELIENVCPQERHPGLQLDKFSPGGDQERQACAIDHVVRCCGDEDLLRQLTARRGRWLDSLRAYRFHGKTQGPMTLHLSRSGALENAGIALHPVYGFAWLPGTGIKGMTRAWAETVWTAGEADPDEAWMRVRTVFGSAPGSEKEKTGVPSGAQPPAGFSAGRIVFHDAWPLEWPRLERDIVNNHHPKYYQGEGDPGDWQDPTPVGFLSIAAGTEFEFAVSDRLRVDDNLVPLAAEWLCAALLHAGAGAKTAAGYGRIIVPVGETRPVPPKRLLRSEHRLELVSPAFLAGAQQEETDCDLRPTTLRGLLRWWWRTMYAGHLACKDLAELETLVWGNTKVGSPVSISVEPGLDNSAAKQYKKQSICREHQLDRPPRNRKVIQGLFYASYGMDERNSESRWYRDAGNCWRMILTVRAGDYELKGRKVSAELLREQARAALWLLTEYGGVGSKARKGFGSFADAKIESIRSIDDCIAAGGRLREACGLPAGGRTDTPSLEDRIGPLDMPTGENDPWRAIDRIGDVYQRFIKSLNPADKRRALGLPREVGKRKLKTSKGDERHASPAHWTLSRNADGTLSVRFIAFPSARLPDPETSGRVLRDLASYAKDEKDEFSKPAETGSRLGRRSGVPHQRRMETQSLSVDAGLPKNGTRIPAILLEERTKKGGWKAEWNNGAMVGHILNSDKVPDNKKSGMEVDLFVKSARAETAIFEWPTPEVEARNARSAERLRNRQNRRRQ